MPRKIELTWQPGSRGRQGRWRKKYKGRILYFAHGSSKSDVEGYKAAFDAWQEKKGQIDREEAERPHPHQVEYDTAIQEWTLVLQWARENSDQQHAGLALQKLDVLKQRLADPNSLPIGHDDRIWGQYTVPKQILDSAVTLLNLPRPDPDDPGVIIPSQQEIESMDGTPSRIATEVWRDRLEGQRRKNQDIQESVGANIDTFLATERARVTAGEVTAGHYDPLRGHLHHFRDWLGARLAAVERHVQGAPRLPRGSPARHR